MKQLTIAGLASLVILLVASCGSGSNGDEVLGIVVTEAETTSEINLASGERFEVRLESIPSSGYRWEVDIISTPSIVTLVSQRFDDRSNDDVVGAPGTDVLLFEAAESGAGILRLEYSRSFDEQPVPERVVEYIIRIEGAQWPPPGDEDPPPASTAVAPSDGSTMFLGDLLTSEPGDYTVKAFVVWDDTQARLCDTLMESFPPQCGGPWVTIANPENLTVALESEGQVRWTQDWVELPGRYDGTQFIVADGNGTTSPADPDPDQESAQALAAFAATSNADTFGLLPLAAEVALGLGPDVDRTVSSTTLVDPSSWVIERDEFRAYSGPFSALDLIDGPFAVSIGAHDRCVAQPEPAPAGFESFRQVSMQPTDATSCLEWWSVDLFVHPTTGEIAAITLDLYGP